MSQPLGPVKDGLRRRALLINGPGHESMAATPLVDLAAALRAQGFEVTLLGEEGSSALPERIERLIRSGLPEDPLLIHYLGRIVVRHDDEGIYLAFGKGSGGIRYQLQNLLFRAAAARSQSTLVTLDTDLDQERTRRLVELLAAGNDGSGTIWTMTAVRTQMVPGPDATLTQALANTVNRVGLEENFSFPDAEYMPFSTLSELVSDEVRRLGRGRLGLSTTSSELSGAIFRHFPNPRFRRTPNEPPLPAAPERKVLAGGISADRVDPGVGIPLSDDQLSLSAYVRMLATVAAHEDTPMPLSIGLFGKWGSGKSYLMGLMREEITRLSKSGNEAFLPDIVQVGFNAWHYSDTNLWASLGDEIFRQLAGTEEDVEAKRARMNAELLETRQYHKLLEAQAVRARQETEELKGHLDEVSSQQDITARELLTQLSTSDTMRKQLAQLWSRLGVADEAERAKALSEEIRGTANEVSALRQLLRSRVGRLATSAAVAALGLFAVAALAPADWGTWLSRAGLATLASSAGTGIAALARFRQGLVQLQQIATEIRDGALAEAKRKNEPKVNELLAELRSKEAEHELAQAQLDELVTRAGELGRQLSALAPGQRLYSFVTERASGDLYTKHLGLVSTIRKDFQNLAELMAAWRKRTAGDLAHRPIDRVILYIDDLDRCHPKQVVQVLQAVHLLLALDPFVVVVGVDPRWLIQSLRQHYDGVLSAEDQGDWSVASPGYLEKIFNIPFIVPDMPAGGLGQLIRGLAGPLDQPGSQEVAEVSVSNAAGDDGATGEDETADEEEVPEDILDAPVAAPTLLTEDEVEFLAVLEPFVETPRDAKRLFNLYRMLRSTPDLVDAATFLDGDEYQAVAVLLGLLTYDANLLSQILPELLTAAPTEKWDDLVARMEPVGNDDGTYTNGIVGAIASEAVGSWAKLYSGAAQTVPEVTLPDLSAFQKWAPRIRRFSFVLSADAQDR